jgi:hypothetical protein
MMLRLRCCAICPLCVFFHLWRLNVLAKCAGTHLGTDLILSNNLWHWDRYGIFMCHGEGMSRNRYWGLSEIPGISCEDHLSPYNWRTMWNIEFVWKHVFTSGHSKIVCFWSSNFCLLLSLVISLTKVTKNYFVWKHHIVGLCTNTCQFWN